jgi:acetyl esterase
MTDLVAPFPADIEAVREMLLDLRLPPVWTLEAAEARMLYRERSLGGRANWRPPLDAMPVVVDDVDTGLDLPPLRRYRPAAADARAETALVWLHGGGWVLGDLDTADPVARTACAATGWTVLSVDYRCAPISPFPAAVTDALLAVDWATERHGTVVVGGDSAGGTLAAVAAQERPVAGQVLVYPATDPMLESESAHAFTEGPFLTRRDMEWFYDQYLRGPGDREHPWARLRPAASTVPAVVLTVGHDPLRDEGIAYARSLPVVEHVHAAELYHGAFGQSGLLPSAAARADEVWRAAQRLVP